MGKRINIGLIAGGIFGLILFIILWFTKHKEYADKDGKHYNKDKAHTWLIVCVVGGCISMLSCIIGGLLWWRGRSSSNAVKSASIPASRRPKQTNCFVKDTDCSIHCGKGNMSIEDARMEAAGCRYKKHYAVMYARLQEENNEDFNEDYKLRHELYSYVNKDDPYWGRHY